jgi:hypothetical protein
MKTNISSFLVTALVLLFGAASGRAENIELEKNEENCAKIDGYGEDDKYAIGATYNVAISSIEFIGARWDVTKWGSMGCVMIFDTPVGPKKCEIIALLSSDGGKSAFGVMNLFNTPNAVCE